MTAPVDADEAELQRALESDNKDFDEFAKAFEGTNSPALEFVGRKPRSGGCAVFVFFRFRIVCVRRY